MPLQVGTMMVVVRAQDFASRTLRRVGGELATLSRAQQIGRAQDMTRIRSVRGLTRELEAQSRLDMLRPLRQQAIVQKRLADVGKQMKALGPTPGWVGQGAVFQKLAAQQNTLRLVAQGLETQIASLPVPFQRLKDNTEALTAATRKANTELRAGRMIQRHAAEDLDALARAARAMPLERLDNIGRAMSGLGRTLQLFGMVGTAAFGLAAKSSADFSTQVSLAATQARNIGDEITVMPALMRKLEEGFRSGGKEVAGILDLMQKYPASSQDMTAATYEIFSGMQLEKNGIIDVAQGLKLLEIANKIAVAGGVELAEATNAMITVFNNFDPRLQNTTKVLDDMFDIVRFGKMRLTDFNVMMNKIAPAAADAGQSLEDIGGAMAVLTTLMPSQRMVATGLARSLEALQHPDVIKGLEMHGVAVRDATGAMRSYYDIIEDIVKEFPALTEGGLTVAEFFRTITAEARGGGRGLIFTQEGRRVISELVHNFDLLQERQHQVVVNQHEFNKAFQQQLKQPGVQFDIFINQLKTLALVIGREAIPVFIQIGEVVRQGIKWFQDLSPATRHAIIYIGALASVLGLFSGVLLAIFGSLLTFEAMLRRMAIGGAGAAGVFSGLLMILRRLAAIGVIILAIKVFKSGDMGVWEFISAVIMGGMIGARFGPAGAVVGAITVPVLLKFTSRLGGEKSPVEQAYEKYLADARKGQNLLDQVLSTPLIPGLGADKNIELGELLSRRTVPEGVKSLDEFKNEWRKTKQYIERNKLDPSSIDAFGRASLEAARKQYPLLDAVLATYKIQSKGKTLWDAVNNSVDRYIKKLKGAEKRDALAQAEEFRKVARELADASSRGAQSLDQWREALDQWKESLADATKQAGDTVLQNLRSMWDRIFQENQQAFGELFRGPWLTSETFDLAKEWGIEPQITDLIGDLRQQNEQFAKWRRGLDAVMKKGLPQQFINELRQMGPEEGQAILDEILGAKPQQVQALIRQWNRRNNQIKQATKMDFTNEINQFKNAGMKMGDAIVNGFRSAQVGQWFENWVKVTFPDVISKAVAEAVRDWKKANPPPARPAGATNRNPGGVGTRGGSNTQTNTQVDRSKKIEATINVNTDSSNTARDKELARQVAFATTVMAKNWF